MATTSKIRFLLDVYGMDGEQFADAKSTGALVETLTGRLDAVINTSDMDADVEFGEVVTTHEYETGMFQEQWIVSEYTVGQYDNQSQGATAKKIFPTREEATAHLEKHNYKTKTKWGVWVLQSNSYKKATIKKHLETDKEKWQK